VPKGQLIMQAIVLATAGAAILYHIARAIVANKRRTPEEAKELEDFLREW
jgi:uncharacterized membrane protein